ncbi:hypothetical protein BS47DRAFT_1369553 [Hydnum rufescens UP504]|uniref:Uncharacterized protein n=1 Tax=Hydnum rufescens UP504 TaxID=1448309 RepID=A0A9P6ACG3_9AGAM|nr:hypothetical protein BS47DRAFT_1369553 [Hydnum rufescens UP504]
MIDEIVYHTPTAVVIDPSPSAKTLHTKKGRAQPPATRNSIQEPSARTPASTPRQMKYHTPTAAGLPSMHETPPNKNTDEKTMCAATRNPIQEPAAASQNEYHTRFGGCVLQVTQKEQPKLLLCDPNSSPQNDDLRPATHPMVNRQAQPLVPHTRPSGCGANFLRDGTTPAQAGVY